MTERTTHRYQTIRQDGPPLSNVQPSHWNAPHQFTAANGVLIGRYSAGTGAAQEISLGNGFLFDEGLLAVGGQLNVDTLALENPLSVSSGGFGGETVEKAQEAILADFTGVVMAYAANTAPVGFLKANGAAVSRTTYARLFERIGTSFGSGNGSTTFNLPDFRAEFIRGWDDGRGIDSGRIINTIQFSQIASHAHAASFTTSADGGHQHQNGDASGARSIGAVGNPRWITSGYRDFWGGPKTLAGAGEHQHNFAITTANSGGATEFRPRNVAMLICIKY